MRREQDTHHFDAPLCRISYWQGYVSGRYYANDGDAGKAIACSAPIRTWTWRHGNIAPHGGAAATAALHALARDLHALGWEVLDSDIEVYAARGDEAPVVRGPEAISRETVLSALSRVSGDDGATAAEVGREVLGPEAPNVRHLPLRVGAELRRLQLQGMVERRENGGSPKWFLTASR